MKEEEAVASTTEKGDLGLTVEQINPEIAENLGLNLTHGVVITAVAPDSVGDEAGLEPGDIIREIDHKPIRNLSDYKKIMASIAQDKSILFLVQREDNTVFLALRREE
jgi:serine protease Do